MDGVNVKLVRTWAALGLMLCSVSLMLAGCGFLPRAAESPEELTGKWVFVDSEGVVSTMTIDGDGRFSVDRAPIEAFNILTFSLDADWSGNVDWTLAEPISGVVAVDQAGQVRFSTQDPEWGGSAAYQDPFRGSLEFPIGNVDNGDSIDYYRAAN